jgi:membrane protein YqaA with SNARE-associated domain
LSAENKLTDSVAVKLRPGPFRRLYNWILRNAQGPYAYAILAVIAFAEASFFPMIPDIVMAPMILADRRRALRIALWCTTWSVLGGALGYAIGSLFYGTVGHWLVSMLGMTGEVDALRVKFANNSWFILVMGLFTPYKLVTISAGIAGVPFPLFMLYSSITRSVRFFAVGGLLYFFGNPVRAFLETWLEYVLVGVLVLIVALIVALHFSLKLFG